VASALAIGALLASAGQAAANTVTCAGSTALGKGKGAAQELDYTFRCTEAIKAFTIVSPSSIDFFSTTADVLDPNKQVVNGQTFSCEGAIPAQGFGCSGTGMPPNAVVGQLTVEGGPCAQPKKRVPAWLVVTDANSKSSPPFNLRPAYKCKQAKTKAKRKRAGH
jgi:hypothetical protein